MATTERLTPGGIFISGVVPLNLAPNFERPRAIFWKRGTLGVFRPKM